ncbi:acyl-phosphate glycerol 3-phosphate acyltransferase [Escherichia coli]|nr:acyl-phosphate glycerol 3-phosphate acyltransferase [Escherichia coli]
MIHVVYLNNHYLHYSANLTFPSISNCHRLPTYRLSSLSRSTITMG